MANRRFEMIKDGFHVGVLDKHTGKVLELVTKDKETAIIQEIDESKFGRKPYHYEITEPVNARNDDDTIKEQWDEVKRWYLEEVVWQGKKLEYHPSGDYENGKLNCEVVAEYVMTGEPNTRNGKWAALLQRLGINVAYSGGGSSGSWASSSR